MLAFAAALRPGDRAVALTPAYQSLHEMPRAMGARLELVPVDEDGDAWRFPFDRLMDALRPGVALLVLNTPHNPTGVAATPDQLRSIMARCDDAASARRGRGVPRARMVVRHRAIGDGAVPGVAVSVGVTSKVYGLAGLRIGWLVTGDPVLRSRAVSIKDYTTLCAAGPSEVLATIAIRAMPRSGNGRARDAKPTWHGSRRSSPITRCVCLGAARATTVSVARITPGLLARHGGDPDVVLAHWREAAGVVVAPGPVFGCPPDRFRLGFGRADLPEALEALAAVS